MSDRKKRGSALSSQIASLLDPTPKEIVPEDEWDEPQLDSDLSDEDEANNLQNDDGRLHLRADISLTQGKYKGIPSTRDKHGYTIDEEDSEEDSDQEDSSDQSDLMDDEDDEDMIGDEDIARSMQNIVRINQIKKQILG